MYATDCSAKQITLRISRLMNSLFLPSFALTGIRDETERVAGLS
jgi:hypothetical protein